MMPPLNRGDAGHEVSRVTADDPAYQAMARAEAAFWATTQEFGCEAQEAVAGATLLDRYNNERLTGDPRTLWYETITRYGSFRRGLALGTSGMGQDGRVLDQNPALRMTYFDISEQSLERWSRELGARYPGRVETQVADLNFAELPTTAFDVIVSSSSIHHIINLEHLAAQINAALTADGRFFLYDYVGETRYRFSAEKKKLFELLYDRDVARTARRKPGLVWRNERDEDRSPFCAIRSGDILEVFGREMAQLELHTSGAVIGPMLFAEPAGGGGGLRRSFASRAIAGVRRRAMVRLGLPAPGLLGAEYVRELMLLDTLMCDSGLLTPHTAFAVYGKRV
jgi:SAM-dependent methyltransferase